MNRDVASRAQSNRQPPAKPPALRSASVVIALVLAPALPAAQTVHATEIYYARAIGQEYLPERSPPPAPSQTHGESAPELPGLGADARQRALPDAQRTWSKFLVGALVVAAIAAVANSGGDAGGQVVVGSGGDSGSPPGSGGEIVPDVPVLPPGNGGGAGEGGGDATPGNSGPGGNQGRGRGWGGD